MVDYIKDLTRPSVSWYKGIMVEQAEDWEYLGYDIREARKEIQGFEFLSNNVKEQQRQAMKHVYFHQSCAELGHTPGIVVNEKKKTDQYRDELQDKCMDPSNEAFANGLQKCTESQWAQYIGSNEDFVDNMPGFQADPFKYIPGNALVIEPCNTLSNGAYYMVADVDGMRADKDGNGGDEHLQQAAANMAYGSLFYHGHGNAEHWENSRFADTIAMDFLFGEIFEQLIKKVCKSIDCINKIYAAHMKEGDQHASLGMYAMTDDQIQPRLISKVEEVGTEGKGFQNKYYTQKMAERAAKGQDFLPAFRNVVPRYTTAVTGVVLIWLRVTFNREIPLKKGDELFDQVSSAIIEALVTKSAQKPKAKAIRDVIRNLDLKVVNKIPDAFKYLTKMLQKFLTAMHFQEVKAGASLLKVFGRYDTCPFVPHSNWHRQSARLIQLIVRGVNEDLDKSGLKDKFSYWDKVTVLPDVLKNIPFMGSATGSIISIARLGMEPKLQEGSKGFEHQVKVNEGLREAIEKRVRSNKLAHHKDFQTGLFSRRRRRPLSMSAAILERSAEQKVGNKRTMSHIMKVKSKKSAETKSTLSRKERKKNVIDWNSDYRNACNRGPPESTDNVYDNYVKQWIKS